MTTNRPRMKNPAGIIPDALAPIQALNAAVYATGVPRASRTTRPCGPI